MPWKRSEAGPCECGWFDRANAEPRVPIEFNQTVGEFHLRYEGCDGPSTLVFYYCPFCGGRAPACRRDTLFVQPTDEELARLYDLTSEIRTIDDALRILGTPETDFPTGYRESNPESTSSPPVFEGFRQLIYEKLSETVEVWVTERPNDRVRIRFSGKRTGSAQSVDSENHDSDPLTA